MGRRKLTEDRERLSRLLLAVNAHPWARLELIRSQSSLTESNFKDAIRFAMRFRLIAQASVRGLGGPPARYALTPAGARRIGAVYSRQSLQRMLLAALKLDFARTLLNRWFAAPGVVWALSPFLVLARNLRPGGPRDPSRGYSADMVYRSLRLDGLACLRLAPGQYLNVALLIDPGNLKAEWLSQQFRSVHAWRRRPEWHRAGQTYFPVTLVVTTDAQRLTEVVQVWRETTQAGEWPGLLRLTTIEDMGNDCWWNEQRQATTLWGGTVACSRPSQVPGTPFACWWGETAADADNASLPAVASGKSLFPTGQFKGLKAADVRRLVDLHQTISVNAREILDRVAQYPLIGQEGLAVVMGHAVRHVRAGLQELAEHALIDSQRANRNCLLTWTGLCLLAGQVGLQPVEYARLRGWPIQQAAEGTTYAAGWLEAVGIHNNLVLDFLVGLCRHGPPRVSLVRWDHVQCLFDLPARKPPTDAMGQPALRSVMPDATGLVRIRRPSGVAFDRPFWLEVDRDSNHGQALSDKLARYYQLGGTWDGLTGNLPWLLILVERGGEGRLQALRRRLKAFNEHYRTHLEVRLARADSITDETGGLNPLKRAWRTVESSEFVNAFER